MCAGECIWLDLKLIKTVLDDCRSLFPVAGYSSITIPTYPCGQIGMIVASLNKVSKEHACTMDVENPNSVIMTGMVQHFETNTAENLKELLL